MADGFLIVSGGHRCVAAREAGRGEGTTMTPLTPAENAVKVAEFMRCALERIRMHTFAPPDPDEPDHREEINDLADILHNLGPMLVGNDLETLDSIEGLYRRVDRHVRRFFPGVEPRGHHRYLEVLDQHTPLEPLAKFHTASADPR